MQDELDRLIDAALAAREGDSNDDEIQALTDLASETLFRLHHPRAGEL